MIGMQIGALRLIRLLGAGGMGSVYLAEHEVLKDRRAVKILDPDFTGRGAVVARFIDEARAAAALRHRNLIQVYDIGQLPDQGPWYMVLEYLDGRTLGRFMASNGGPVAPHELVHLLAQVLNCMQWVHSHGVVHRDLKPENVFIIHHEDDPLRAIVLDLGVAQMSDDFATGPGTKTGTVIGTPLYMAPEQLLGRRVTAAADIYAVGVIAYEMATGGWFPYQYDGSRSEYIELPPAEIFHRQKSGPPVDPRTRFAGISEALSTAILSMLDVDPMRRPANAREAANRLAEAAPTDGVNPDGLAILRQVARELTKSDNVHETLRSPRRLAEAPSPSLATRYQLGDKVGAGGMAEVFVGTQLGAEGFVRRVAIKRVLAGLSEVAEFAAMFTAEARLVCRLSDPNIVTVLDFSRDDSGRLFLVMEYVDGRDLSKLIDAGGPIATSTVIYIITEMLRGLGYAHHMAVVHRDVSPQNVLLSFAGEVKVSDFGLAKMRDASGNVWSEQVRGTAAYMSPEQANGEPLDGRSDLHAVGVILWELLASQPLFRGSQREVVAQVMFKDVPLPSSVRSRVPGDLETIAMRLLARNRDERYLTAQAAIEDLLQCQDAPRDGRGDLARLLAERFPRTTTNARPSAPGAIATHGRLAAPIPAAPPASTLAGAASQSIRPPQSKIRRGLLAGVASALIATGTVGAITIARDSASDQTRQGNGGRLAETQLPDASPRMSPVDASLAFATPIDAPNNVPPPLPDAGVIVDAGIIVDASVTTRPPPAQAVRGVGELVIAVRTWAMVTLNGRAVGEAPLRRKLAAGTYRVRITNEDAGKDETVTVTVSPDRSTTIQRTW